MPAHGRWRRSHGPAASSVRRGPWGITPPAISQRVRNIDQRLDAVLIPRGRPCIDTKAGARLCRHMDDVGMPEDALLPHPPDLAGPGLALRMTLEIATNADSLGTWPLPAMASFARHMADWLRQGRVLAAVTSIEKPEQGCLVKPLGRPRHVATASLGFMQCHFAMA